MNETASEEALLSTSLPGFPAPKRGKVREIYDLGESLLIVATDRISAFDVVMANGIPDKGRILNQMSAYWFDKLSDVSPNHVETTDDAEIAVRIGVRSRNLAGRSTIARKAKPLAIECVARGYLSGSLYKEYRKEGGSVHGLNLPEGLMDSSRLSEPIFTPATKAHEGHDENISFQAAVDLVGQETAETVRRLTLELYAQAAWHAASVGLILADTKFEFGETADGIIWIDEALTPDSSRYWPEDTYQAGKPQPSFDKQGLRDFLEATGWNKLPPGPTLPPDVVAATRDKYYEAFRRITGQSL